MSVHSWDYTDPSLTRIYLQLSIAKNSIQQDINSIKGSYVLSSNIKLKLLNKKQEIYKEIIERLERHKIDMVDYYDKQTNILTKDVDVPKEKMNIDESTIQNSKINENLMNITFEKQKTQYPKRGKKSRRILKRLQRIINYQKSVIKVLKLKKQPQKNEQQQLENNNIQNEQYIELLKTKLNMLEDYYSSREASINSKWQNLFKELKRDKQLIKAKVIGREICKPNIKDKSHIISNK